MHRLIPYVLLLLAGLCFATAAAAQVDLSGTWDLEATATLPSEGTPAEDCTFEGSADVAQDGIDLTGTAQLDLVDGVPGCPGTLIGDLTASLLVDGPLGVGGDLIDPQLGQVSFVGEFVGEGSLEGSYDAVEGPFAGASGLFVAVPQEGTSPVGIPTLTPWMLSTLALLLAIAAVVLLVRRMA